MNRNSIVGAMSGMFVVAVASGSGAPALAVSDRTERDPLAWSVALAESEIARLGDSLEHGRAASARWDYTTGLFATALWHLSDATGDESFRSFATRTIGSFVTADGEILTYNRDEFNIDHITPGNVLLLMLDRTNEPRLRQAVELLRSQLAQQPRTSEGGFWHKQRYPNQMWLDGLYMGSPFYAHYGKRFGQPSAFDDVTRQILLMDRHAYDPAQGLHYHAWDESRDQAWADKETGTSPHFWARAQGWYAMALVDVLDFIPGVHPDMEAVVEVLRRVAEGIARHQDPGTGVWWQVMDQGGREGNYLESSASSMFAYALAKAVNRGYLPRATYLPVIRRGYEGILREFIRVDAGGSTSLTKCCQVAGLGYTNSAGRPRDGSFDYYMSEPIVDNDLKGVGPFILAGIEVDRLLQSPASTRNDPIRPALSWDDFPDILARIVPPVFPDRDFPITAFGATRGADVTGSIRRAIRACHDAGGGRVVVPPGDYLTGAIHLLSNVNLHVSNGATLRFSTNPAAYLPLVFTRWEGVECMNYSSLIYAHGQENIAVTGEGTLDGQADWDTWWSWNNKAKDKPAKQLAARDRLMAMGESAVPVESRTFGEGSFLRPNFIQFYRCRSVLLEGFSVRRSPMWEIHPVLCSNVTIRGLDIGTHGPNNDGCDPESSTDVLIEDCVFDTGDDCIAIKSGRNNDGRRVGAMSANIIVRNCTMKDGHGGVVIGSEISGGCRNVFVEDCTMSSPNLDRALRFKSNARRGGVVESVFMRNVEVGQVTEAVLTIDFLYEEGADGDHPPTVRRVRLDNITSRASPRIMWIAGFPAATIDDIAISNSTFAGVTSPERIEYAGSVRLNSIQVLPAGAKRSANSVVAQPSK